MGRLINIVKVAEDENAVAYKYSAHNERAGLVIIDISNRDFLHAVCSENPRTYFAVKYKLSKCFDADTFPESLTYASG